jgi:hypothetical protein
MRNRILASLAIVAAVIVGGLSVPTGLPPHAPGEHRTAHLEVCISDPVEWQAWALAWCPDGDAVCIDNNDDVQGVPMCLDGVPVGTCAKTPATPSQEARMDAAGMVLGGADLHGWSACPDVSTP